MTPTDRYLTFARAQRPPKTPVFDAVDPKSKGDGVVVLRIYDVIDSWGGPYGVSAKEVAEVLDGLAEDVTEIRVHINSPGGESTEGFAILNLLRQHPARVVTVVDGLAASAASYIAMAGDEVLVAPNSELMIHDAWGMCVGPAEDMTAFAGLLNHLSDNIASIYAGKAGGTTEQWREAMQAESWYSADEAVAAKLADRVLAQDSTEDAPKARFDLSVFAFAGRSNAPAPKTPATTSVSGSTENPEESMSLTDAQVADLRTRLGITDENADGDTILAALDEALAEQPTPPEATPPTAVIPDGHVVIPEARLRDLEAGAQAGTQAAAHLREQERAAFLDSVKAKFLPANRAAWEAEYDRDPEATKAHFATAPNILPVAALGHAGEPELAEDEAIYAELYGSEKKVS